MTDPNPTADRIAAVVRNADRVADRSYWQCHIQDALQPAALDAAVRQVLAHCGDADPEAVAEHLARALTRDYAAQLAADLYDPVSAALAGNP